MRGILDCQQINREGIKSHHDVSTSRVRFSDRRDAWGAELFFGRLFRWWGYASINGDSAQMHDWRGSVLSVEGKVGREPLAGPFFNLPWCLRPGGA